MIIILTISIFIIFISVIKYQIAKKKKTNRLDLEKYQILASTLIMLLIAFLIIFLSILNSVNSDIRNYNKYYFKEKNKTELLILENNIFSGTIIKWWAKDYPKLK